mmetsp:Transcript_32032/g.95964  ORF Transcript_32032/g.95964 Transcript_32032/m.95964 type:complete len:211 (+) Transcript_32032:545-1177(+)
MRLPEICIAHFVCLRSRIFRQLCRQHPKHKSRVVLCLGASIPKAALHLDHRPDYDATVMRTFERDTGLEATVARWLVVVVKVAWTPLNLRHHLPTVFTGLVPHTVVLLVSVPDIVNLLLCQRATRRTMGIGGGEPDVLLYSARTAFASERSVQRRDRHIAAHNVATRKENCNVATMFLFGCTVATCVTSETLGKKYCLALRIACFQVGKN